ncbi:Fic family protein [Patescibacteria group bacterium]|nr:Fic family protein [Candidatus Falkowbacteria bacterium]MBU3905820.1 Fic family protein [Patescibacteria group bacterium]MCG2698560.1 Fic family protein [Candidatus Parcubacteria bacterium]MBU4014891.1 Fic family protein [Patescibacteria group bacterium]MBU4026549.1 Fic family protein [Patescibacteria group bacterium]
MFKPKYAITNKILNDLNRSSEIKSLVAHTPIMPRQELKLRREAMIRMIHSSTSIEGNILNRYEVEKVLAGEKVDAPKRDIAEVKNYRDALYYISKFLEKKQKITVKTILEIHRLAVKNVLEKDKCGKFRKNNVYVVSRKAGKIVKVSYTGPKPDQVPKLVKDLISWLDKTNKEKICPVLVSALAHSEIAAIHPFADGNGRTARLLATLILYQRGYDFRKLFALEDYYNQDRPSYYKAIHLGKNYKERLQNDLTNWITYFSHGFAYEMEKIYNVMIPLSLDAKMLKKLGGPVYLDKKQIHPAPFKH